MEDNGGLAETGVVYVPKPCRETPGCRVHIAFHGCAQNRETVGDAFISELGFARWADTNRLIIFSRKSPPRRSIHKAAGIGGDIRDRDI